MYVVHFDVVIISGYSVLLGSSLRFKVHSYICPQPACNNSVPWYGHAAEVAKLPNSLASPAALDVESPAALGVAQGTGPTRLVASHFRIWSQDVLAMKVELPLPPSHLQHTCDAAGAGSSREQTGLFAVSAQVQRC